MKKKYNEIVELQKSICKKYQANFFETGDNLKVGISENVKQNILPINGLRIYPEGDTSGWYIWAGEELSQNPNFFVPLHIKHINEWVPNISRFLGLAPGWRFILTGNYEDVRFDSKILEK